MAEVNDSVDTNLEVTSAIWSVPLLVSSILFYREGGRTLV
jgi:hypothetical protein